MKTGKFKIGVLSFVMAVIGLMGCATTPYEPVEVTNVVEVAGKNQREIYDRSRQWFSQHFVSGESVVDYEDPEAGTIIGNGIAEIGSDGLGIIKHSIEYNIRIDTKDGRFRTVTNIHTHRNTDSNSTYDVNYVTQGRIDKAKEHVNELVGKLEDYVADESIGGDSDW